MTLMMPCLRIALMSMWLGIPGLAYAQSTLTPEQLQNIKASTVRITVSLGSAAKTGSGFLVHAEEMTGYIVTNDHVIDSSDGPEDMPAQAAKIQVVFQSGTPDERSIPATVVVRDPETDLAVLKLTNVKDLPKPFNLSDPPMLMETLPVLVCGFPFGQRNIDIGNASVSSLILHGDGRLRYVQLTGSLNPGNSGGPILTSDGRLVGVAVMKIRDAGKGLAIPQEEVAAILRGRPGDMELTPGENDKAQLKVNILDPLGKVSKVIARYKLVDGGLNQFAKMPEALPDAMEVPMALQNGIATAELPAPKDPKTNLLVQVELTVPEGTVRTSPRAMRVSVPQQMLPGDFNPRRAPRIRLPSGQILPLPTLGQAFISDEDVLTDLIRSPESFVGRNITFEALSNGSINFVGNQYELVIETNAERSPINLRPVVAKDLALQLTDLGIIDPYKFVIRVQGTVQKPVGRDDRHLIDIASVAFLDSSGSVVTTMQSESTLPKGEPTLSTINRFPEQFVGRSLTIDGIIKGALFAGRGHTLEIANQNDAIPMNLEFYTAKDLHNLLSSEVPNTGAAAKIDLRVERVDAKTGKGIIGVNKVEIYGVTDKPKTLSTSQPIPYPTPSAVPKARPTPATSTPAATASTAPLPDNSTQAPKAQSNTKLILIVAAALVLGLVGMIVAYFLMRPKGQVGQTGDLEEAPPKARTTYSGRAQASRPAARPAPKSAPPQPAEEDGDFPGFDFERKN